MSKLSLAVFAVLLATARVHGLMSVLQIAYPKFYLDCGPDRAVHKVTVDGCDHNKDCAVELNSIVKINYTFSPNRKAEEVKFKVFRFNKPESTYDPIYTKDACAGDLPCPLTNDLIDFSVNVPIENLSTTERHLMKTTLTNENGEILMCAVFMLSVV